MQSDKSPGLCHESTMYPEKGGEYLGECQADRCQKDPEWRPSPRDEYELDL
jgi:hypothetical protein